MPAPSDEAEVERLRTELVAMSHRVFERGLVTGTGGNISVRLPMTNQLLITRSGVSLGEVGPDDLVRLDSDGRVLQAVGAARPSIETPIHLAAYRLRPDVRAIIHLHPTYSVVVSLRGEPLPLVTISARLLLGHVPCIPVAYPATRRLHAAMERVFEEYPRVGVVLMQAHGLTAFADSLAEVFHLADLCEATAQQAYLARLGGVTYRLPEPEELSDD